MNAYSESVLRHMIHSRTDLFGEGSTYVRFEYDDHAGRMDESNSKIIVNNGGGGGGDNNNSNKFGFNSTLLYGSIVYRAANGVNLRTPSLAVKQFPPRVPQHRQVTMQYYNEMYFYSRILPYFHSLDSRIADIFPRFYDASVRMTASGALEHQHQQQQPQQQSPSEASTFQDAATVVLENVQPLGYRPYTRFSYADYPHLALMMRTLGRFHAYSYRSKQLHPRLVPKVFGNHLAETHFSVLGLLSGAITSTAQRGLRALGERSSSRLRYDPKRLANLERLVNAAENLIGRVYTGETDNDESVVCHGDFMHSNVVFRYEDRNAHHPTTSQRQRLYPSHLKFVDPAFSRVASPVVDLALVLYVNADQRMRDEHWDDLLDAYCAGVGEMFPQTTTTTAAAAAATTILKIPTKEELLGQFRERALLAYFVASYYFVRMLAVDQQFPDFPHYLPDEYKNQPLVKIPKHILLNAINEIGGEYATNALVDILEDMLDRNFI